MSPRRILRVKRVRKIGRVPKAGPLNVSRAEFDAVVKQLNERAAIINDLRRELHATCDALDRQIQQHGRDLHTQFTRIAQMQREIDELKRNR
jgi:uncharacterized coiled-coil DUF342 family protein